MVNLLTLTMTMLASTAVQQNQPASSMDIARAYISAYEQQDFDAMRGLMADDAVLIDPTSFDLAFVQAPIHWTGADEILEGISAWNIARGEYHIDRVYEAAERVVFDASMDVYYATSEGERGFRYPIITIVTVENGLVTEHRDYTGFNEMAPLPAEGETR